MSNSQHPIALSLERRVGGATILLATVMGLPLVDGIFPALVLAGMLDTVGGILQIGLLVFSGSATVAVVLAELEGDRRDHVISIASLGVVLMAVAAAEAALAPTIKSVLDLAIFERFAALVILAVAAKTASARIGEFLPRPAVIVGLGAIASFDPGGATLTVTLQPELLLRGALAAGVGVAFALVVAVMAPTLRGVVDIDRFRFGSAVALGVLPLSLLGFVPGPAPLAVLVVAGVLAFDPDGSIADVAAEEIEGFGTAADGGSEPDAEVNEQPANASQQSSEERAPWL
ncbi:MAG: DUF5794 domain-containing protein [Halobacteriales archaeon]|nr:DUF5794 domain-containing protein [Halobacteriales archaeon]